MAVPSNHVYVRGTDALLAALQAHIDGAEALVHQQAAEHLNQLQGSMQAEMRENEQWSPLADKLQGWGSGDEDAQFGFRDDEETAAQAFGIEYGDERGSPPQPNLRMGVLGRARSMGHSMTDKFRRGGY